MTNTDVIIIKQNLPPSVDNACFESEESAVHCEA